MDLVKNYQELQAERAALVASLPALETIKNRAVQAYQVVYDRCLCLDRVLKDMTENVAEVKASIEK